MKRDMSGTIGKNDRKTKDSHPTHSGSALIGGTEYWISGWVKASGTGSFLSMSFKAKEPKESIEAPPEFNDDLPF
jgi:hypothetical protein